MSNNQSMRIAVVGDLFIDRDDPPSVFAGCIERLKQANVRLGNQEMPYTDGGTPERGKMVGGRLQSRLVDRDNPIRQKMVGLYRSAPHNVAGLKAAGFDAVGTANNHALDYGVEGLMSSLRTLDEAGIPHAGSGVNFAAAHQPAFVDKNGLRIALLSYSSVFVPGWAALPDAPGIAVVRVATAYEAPPRVMEQPGAPPIVITTPDPVDRENMEGDVKKAREKADLVIISWHWGVSQGYGATVSYQQELGHAAIDAGADLVFGHHPHMLQGIDVYRGKVIAYSLGNFIFDAPLSGVHGLETGILECEVRDKKIVGAAFVPAMIDHDTHVPTVLSVERGRNVIDLIARLSQPFGTRFRNEADRAIIELA